MKKTLLLIATLACAALANAAGTSDALSVLNTFIATYAKDNPSWKSNIVLLSDPSNVPAGRQLGYSAMIGYYSFEPKTWEDLTDTQKQEIYEDSRLKPFLVSLRNPSNYPTISNADVPVPYQPVYPVEGLSAPQIQQATPKAQMQPTGVRPMMQVAQPMGQQSIYPQNQLVWRQVPATYRLESVPVSNAPAYYSIPSQVQPMQQMMPQGQMQMQPQGYPYGMPQMQLNQQQMVPPMPQTMQMPTNPQSFQPNASSLLMQEERMPNPYYQSNAWQNQSQPSSPQPASMSSTYPNMSAHDELYQPVADYKAPTAKSAPQPASVKIAPEEMILDRPLKVFLHNNR